MAAREDDIILAARTMFTRYGYSRTTMGDIASEAGVARQTVYNAFPGKAEILRAVVRYTGDETHDKVMAAWASENGSISDKLEAFQRLGPIRWYEAIKAAPDCAELFEGMHTEAVEELSVIDARWIETLAAMLVEAGVRSVGNDPSLGDIVEFFYSASANAKYGAEDVEHLKRRLGVARAATLALLDDD